MKPAQQQHLLAAALFPCPSSVPQGPAGFGLERSEAFRGGDRQGLPALLHSITTYTPYEVAACTSLRSCMPLPAAEAV